MITLSDGTETIYRSYETTEEKLESLRLVGWMLDDADAILYGRLYKKKRQSQKAQINTLE